eukprot:sb/3473873/
MILSRDNNSGNNNNNHHNNNRNNYNHNVKRAPSSTGTPRSFKLVDGSNIITGAVVPTPNQTTLIIRDIPYQSNDSALLSHHLGRFGAIKQLQCKVYNDNHTATVEFHKHEAAVNCFNSNLALLGCRPYPSTSVIGVIFVSSNIPF